MDGTNCRNVILSSGDFSSGKLLQTTREPYKRSIRTLELIDENNLISGCYVGSHGGVEIFKWRRNREISKFGFFIQNPKREFFRDEEKGNTTIEELLYIRKHNRVISLNNKYDESRIKIWDYATGKKKYQIKAHTFSINRVVNYDDDNFVTCSYDKTIRVWDMIKEKSRITFTDHKQCIFGLSVYNSEIILSGSNGKNVKLFKIDQKKAIHTISFPQIVYSVLPFYNGYIGKDLFIAGGYQGMIAIYDFRRLDKPVVTWEGHKPSNISVVRQIDRKLFATASYDKTVKIWNVKGKLFGVLREKEQVYGLAVLNGPFFNGYNRQLFKDVKERINEVVEIDDGEEKNKIKIILPNVEIEIERWMLCNSSLSENIEIIIEEKLQIKEKKIKKILMGVNVKIPFKILFDYFKFFQYVKLRDVCFCLCLQLKFLSKDDLEWIMVNSFTKTETCEISFQSKEKDFKFQNLFWIEANLLIQDYKIRDPEFSDNVGEIQNVKKCLMDLSKIKLGRENKESILLSDITREKLTQLFENKKFTDIKLKVKGGNLVLAHSSVLIYRSQFFHMLLKGEWKEISDFKASGELEIEYLSLRSLDCLLEWIYTGKISKTDYYIIKSLLEHAEKYQEYLLKSFLLELSKN